MPRGSCQLDHPREDHSYFVKLFSGSCSTYLTFREEDHYFSHDRNATRDVDVLQRGCALLCSARLFREDGFLLLALKHIPTRPLSPCYIFDPRDADPQDVFAFFAKRSSFSTKVMVPRGYSTFSSSCPCKKSFWSQWSYLWRPSKRKDKMQKGNGYFTINRLVEPITGQDSCFQSF